MSRKIRYRAYYKPEKRMIYDIQNEFEERIELGMDCFADYLNNDDFVVEQYTGLKDKNGKEIYEGGVVKVVLFTRKGNKGRYKKDGVEEIGYIRFEEGVFKICFAKNKAGEPTSSLRLDDLRWETYGEVLDKTTWYKYDTEVIGNIHENPELLEKTE